jgi:protein-tyrosine phosphatase
MGPKVETMNFSILTVCTGNICRSPLAEQLLRSGLEQWQEISVSSAGTGALVGQAMTDQAQAISRELGGTGAEHHVARSLDIDMLREADLVLALSREHRSAVVGMLPRGSRHTFTVRELARLLEDVPDTEFAAIAAIDIADVSARVESLIDLAASRRGMVMPPEALEDDDVIDPYRRSDDVYRESAGQLVPAIRTILAQINRAATVER